MQAVRRLALALAAACVVVVCVAGVLLAVGGDESAPEAPTLLATGPRRGAAQAHGASEAFNTDVEEFAPWLANDYKDGVGGGLPVMRTHVTYDAQGRRSEAEWDARSSSLPPTADYSFWTRFKHIFYNDISAYYARMHHPVWSACYHWWNHWHTGAATKEDEVSWVLSHHILGLWDKGELPREVAAPTFDPTGSESPFVSKLVLKIETSTPEAAIFYTTDGSTPTRASIHYDERSKVGETIEHIGKVTVKAFAIAKGFPDSKVSEDTFLIIAPVYAPTFSPNADGAYVEEVAVHLASATPGAQIYFTTDGSEPTRASKQYHGAFVLDTIGTVTVKAFGVHDGMADSPVATHDYDIIARVGKVDIEPRSAGPYTEHVDVSMGTETPMAVIFYTTDGSAPTTQSTPYAGPFRLAHIGAISVQAFATAQGLADSFVASQQYTVLERTQTPTFSPHNGTFPDVLHVDLSSTTNGATIHYTTDGSTPTLASPVYGGQLSVPHIGRIVVKAIAEAPGMAVSHVGTHAYTVLERVAPVEFEPLSSGPYTLEMSLSMSCATTGATIHYTTDGSAPTHRSPTYKAGHPVVLNSVRTYDVRAIATALGKWDSVEAVHRVVVQAKVATPVFDPTNGTFPLKFTLAIACETPGATIHYTIDASVPTASSPLYSGPVLINTLGIITVKAMATHPDEGDSGVATQTFNVLDVAEAPVFAPGGPGPYTDTVTLSATTATNGGVIHFTTDGSTPNHKSPKYEKPIVVTQTGDYVYKAFTSALGKWDSAVTVHSFRVQGRAAAPTITPNGGSFVEQATVTMASVTPGAVVHYTTDGSTPSPSSPAYSGPITLTQTGTLNVQAVAVASGWTTSLVASAQFEIKGRVAAPVFTPARTPLNGRIEVRQGLPVGVTATSATGGAAIHYTVDGSDPTAASPVWPAEFAICKFGKLTFKGLAVAPGMEDSAITVFPLDVELKKCVETAFESCPPMPANAATDFWGEEGPAEPSDHCMIN